MSSRHDDVTVVITNYNYARYLEEAVVSALGQTGGPPGVIVVDDGSTEAEAEMVLDHLPPKVRVLRQDNAGPCAARNAGLAHANTPLAIVLDADDRLRPDTLEVLKPPLHDIPTLGFTYGNMRFFGAWEGEMTMPPYNPYTLLYRHTIGLTALMRRELIDDVGGFDPEFYGYEDWELWLHALARGWRGFHVGETTLDYRRHGASFGDSARRGYHETFRRIRERHADLYARRAELAREAGVGPIGRAVYRWWWGARPLPARVETTLHAMLWSAARRRAAPMALS